MANPPPQSEAARRQAESAKKLVLLSHILGWGGLVLLFGGAPAIGAATHSGMAAIVTAAVGGIAAVAGAIVGQIGRGMQGRVI